MIEVLPPAVQTELHDTKHQRDLENGRSIAIALAEFVKDAWTQLSQGAEQIPVGMVKANFGQEAREVQEDE